MQGGNGYTQFLLMQLVCFNKSYALTALNWELGMGLNSSPRLAGKVTLFSYDMAHL